MDKKSIIVVAICMVILFGWQAVVDHIWPPPKETSKPPQATNAVAAAVSPTAAPPQAAPAPVAAAPAVPTEPAKPRPPEQTATLENEFVRAELTSYGGGIRDVLLKQWHVAVKHPDLVKLNQYGADPVFSLTGGSVKDTNSAPMLAAWPGADTNAVYALRETVKDRAVFACDLPAAGGGLRVVKEFQLGSNYVLTCRLRFENTGKQPLATPAWGVLLGTAGQLHEKDDPTFVNVDFWNGQAVSMTGRAKAEYHVASSLAKKPLAVSHPIRWAAVKNQYFATVLTPAQPAAGMHAEKVELPRTLTPQASDPPLGVRGVMLFDGATVQAGDATEREFQLYVGPKEFKRLAALGDKQEEVMEFGMWGRISEALLWMLTKVYQVIPNYGIAIIIITLVIKLIFWPVQAMSTRSMKKMQALQPQLAKLKEKYPDDPQKQNQEMMKLYKEHKVNPMGGCLPLLVQIPVFFALYMMLRSAIELRGASFLWIRDLGAPDTIFDIGGFPVNPLPLAMTATTLWQQKLTPQTSVDPTQQKMMMLMPVMFLFFFYNMSSGLVLYWTVQNLLSILQQWMALRDQKPGAPAAPAAKPKAAPTRR
jgi:YidC/Oxa1 family membrane protein insertase